MVFVPTPPHKVTLWESPAFRIQRYVADGVAAGTASFLVSPFIAIVDRAVVENQSGRSTIRASVTTSIKTLGTSPFQFFKHRAFLWTWSLYAGTYFTANVVDTTCEWVSTPARTPKFAITTAVNLTFVMAKDVAFARMFGASKPHRMPKPAFGLFAIRDAHTVGASFLLPPIVSAELQRLEIVSGPGVSDFLAQLLCPMAIQVVSTPYHILAMDLYNRPQATLASRLRVIRDKYNPTLLLRVARIGPAFGLGGSANRNVREKAIASIENGHNT